MPAKTKTIGKKKDFEKIFKQGRSYYTKLLGIKVAPGEASRNRFAIIINAKVSKKAVIRNRLKRQLKEALKKLDSGLAHGYDLVIIALPALVGQDYQTLAQELEKIFFRLGLKK